MPRHPLKREIIATHVTNSMINRVGSTFVHRLMRDHRRQRRTRSCARTCSTREIFGLVPLWQAIEALDNKVDDAVQAEMLIDTGRLIERGTTWFLRSRRLADDMAGDDRVLHAGRGGARRRSLPQLLDAGERARVDADDRRIVAQGVPQDLAARVVRSTRCTPRSTSPRWPADAKRPVELVAAIYFDLATAWACLAAREDRGAARRRSTGRCSPRARCRTTCRACSAPSPRRCWQGGGDVGSSRRS